MSRMVQCVKFGKELPGMSYVPFKTELGQRIYENASQSAWEEWIEFSKRIVNEYRLDLTSPAGHKMLLDQAEQYFFGDGGQQVADYVPPADKAGG